MLVSGIVVSVVVNLTFTLQVAPRRSRDVFSHISAMLPLAADGVGPAGSPKMLVAFWGALECCWLMLLRLLIELSPLALAEVLISLRSNDRLRRTLRAQFVYIVFNPPRPHKNNNRLTSRQAAVRKKNFNFAI